MTGPVARIRRLFGKVSRRGDAGAFADLRAEALSIDPETLLVAEDEPWSAAPVVVMEIGKDKGTTTVIAAADGTVGLQESGGKAILDAGEHIAVRTVARRFRQVVGESRGLRTTEDEFARPTAGMVSFHALMGSSRYTATVHESLLRSDRHALAPLYAAGQDLINEIRLASE